MATPYTITIDVDVHDERELFEAAAERYREENADRASADIEAEIEDFLGTATEPKVSACLVQLADPGMSWPGTSILNSSAE
jgi:hypothetical protein